VQQNVYEMLRDFISELESHVIINQNTEEIVEYITALSIEKGEIVNGIWQALLPYLFTHYRDGYVLSNLDKAELTITPMFYPRWWLEKVGFFQSSPNKDADIFFKQNTYFSNREHVFSLATNIAMLLVGIFIGRFYFRNAKSARNRAFNMYGTTPESMQV
jgi:hypothetical protein